MAPTAGSDGRPMVVDAHHHFWRYGEQHQPWRSRWHDVIARDFLPADLAGDLAAAGVDATVLIQSVDSEAENARLLDFALEAPFVAAVVAWLPLRDAGLGRRILAGFDANPVIRGVRCLIGRDRSDWLTAPQTTDLFRAVADRRLSWDVVPVTSDQVRDVVSIAGAVPELRVVVDHLARPPIEAGTWQPWADGIEALGSLPNVALKVSIGIDLLTEWDGWSRERLVRYLHWAASCFGPHRLMLASNWPVVLLRRGYVDAWLDLSAALVDAGVTAADLVAVRGGNAVRWYRFPARGRANRGQGAGERGDARTVELSDAPSPME